MCQAEKEPDEREATPVSADDTAAPAVREIAVGYAVRPRPPAAAPAGPLTPAAGDGLARLQAAAEAGDRYALLAAWRAIEYEFTDDTGLEFEAEREVPVLLPPRREYTTTAHVYYVGRAQPLVSLDDIGLSHDL